MRVSIVATALDGQQPESKSVINMVHRIQNRNPGYSDFSNINAAQSFNFSNSMQTQTPVTEGATALKLENEIAEQKISDTSYSNEINNNSASSSLSDHSDLQEKEQIDDVKNEIKSDFIEDAKSIETESISNGLENFGIEEEAPELFNSENSEIVEDSEKTEQEFSSFDTTKNQEDDDELEIPAFLRRQKN